MARDFLASQIRTSQIIASRSLSNIPSIVITSASNASGTGILNPGPPTDPNVFLFVSGSRGSDAITLFGGSVKTSGSLTVLDNVTLGVTPADTVTFNGVISSNFVPSPTRTYTLGTGGLQWLQVHSHTGSLDFLSVAERGNFPAGLSGSIQQTSAGISYLVAGTGVTIASASNGQITISSTGGGGLPGGLNTQIQFNDSGAFQGDDGLTYDKNTKTLSVGNLFVTGSITAITTSNLTISDPIIYLGSGSTALSSKSAIAFASGSTQADKSLIVGPIGGNDTVGFARQDVSGGLLLPASLSFSEYVPLRASSFQLGGPSCFLTSSDSVNLLLRSTSGLIDILPGSPGLRMGNSAGPVGITGSNVRVGSISSEFGGEIPPIPGIDVYFFVSGSFGGQNRALFGGDVVSSGSFIVKDPSGITSVIGTTTGILSASSNIQGGGNLLIAGNATARGGLLTLSNTSGDAAINQDGSGNFTIRNLVSGGQFLASVRTSGGVTSNFLDVRPNGSLTGSVISIFPSSIYAGASNPFFSTDTTFFVAGKRGAKDGINRGTAVFGGDAVISGSAFVGTDGSDRLVILADLGSDIIPDSNVTRNLGSPVRRFANVYTGDLHLKNDRGDYTLIEEEECLTIRFNKTGKRYKFVLEPAPEFD